MNYKESNVKLNEAENKIKPFPLGIDFHTMHKEDHWGEKKTHWTKQNEIVHDIYFRASMKKWQNREYTLLYTGYSNTHGTRTSKGFLSLENASFTKHSGSCKQQGKCSTSRWETLEMMGKSKFVLAPRGLGMSTIRFYEALTVGAIPICDKLHSESMNNLHKMLGGIIVEDWKEVNSDNLSKWEDLITSNKFEEDEHVRHLEFSKRDYLYTEFWLVGDIFQLGRLKIRLFSRLHVLFLFVSGAETRQQQQIGLMFFYGLSFSRVAAPYDRAWQRCRRLCA